MLKVKRLTNTAYTPVRQTEGAAGFDLHADESIRLWPEQRVYVSTGVAVKIPAGHVGQVWPRSSVAGKGLDTSAGVIDEDYTGELKVLLVNNGSEPRDIEAGDRIAQLLVVPVFQGVSVEVQDLEQTERGENGFGSTGK